MQSYTVVLRNAHGRVISRLEFGCADDAEARLVARDHAKGRAAELWNGDRRIDAWSVTHEREAAALIDAVLREPLPVPSGAAVIATNLPGLISHWNAGAAALYGWTAREALGRNIVGLTPATQSRTQASEIMQTLQAGRSWAGEMLLHRKDGGLFRAFVLDIPVDGDADRPGGVVGVSLPKERGHEILQARAAIEAELRRRFGPPAAGQA